MATIIVTNPNQTGVGSISEALSTASSGDVIQIQVSSISITSEIIIYIDYLTIDSDVNGLKSILDGGNSSRFFRLESDLTLTITNTVLQNGRGLNDGGAISCDPRSTLILKNCDFYGNTSDTVCGAIFMKRGFFLFVLDIYIYHRLY